MDEPKIKLPEHKVTAGDAVKYAAAFCEEIIESIGYTMQWSFEEAEKEENYWYITLRIVFDDNTQFYKVFTVDRRDGDVIAMRMKNESK